MRTENYFTQVKQVRVYSTKYKIKNNISMSKIIKLLTILKQSNKWLKFYIFGSTKILFLVKKKKNLCRLDSPC